MLAIQVNQTGGPEALTPAEVEEPRSAPGRVIVEVIAAGLNFIDTYHRDGLYPLDLPFVPGMEGSGVIVDVGAGVEDLEVGDTVAWADVLGSYAAMASLPAERVVAVPAGIDPEAAAAVMLQGLTAHYLATSTFPLASGNRCLIHAGAGGVGALLIQIAKRSAAEVFTTVGSPEKGEIALAAGADHVIHYREVPFTEAVEKVAGPRPLDVVYDGVGASTFQKGLSVLKPRGLMVTFGNASGPVEPISPLVLSQGGSLFLTRPTLGDYIRERPALLARSRDLFDWMLEGSFEVRIGSRHPLEEAQTAHRQLEGRQTTGKTLLIP